MHFEITLVKGLWITSCGNVTIATSGPAGLLGMKLLKYIFLQHNVRQKRLVFSLRFKIIIIVMLDLIVFCRITYVFTSKQLHDWGIWIKQMEMANVSVLKINWTKNVLKDQSKPSSTKRKFSTTACW